VLRGGEGAAFGLERSADDRAADSPGESEHARDGRQDAQQAPSALTEADGPENWEPRSCPACSRVADGDVTASIASTGAVASRTVRLVGSARM